MNNKSLINELRVETYANRIKRKYIKSGMPFAITAVRGAVKLDAFYT